MAIGSKFNFSNRHMLLIYQSLFHSIFYAKYGFQLKNE